MTQATMQTTTVRPQEREHLEEARRAAAEAVDGFPDAVATPLVTAVKAILQAREELARRLRERPDDAGLSAVLKQVNLGVTLLVGMQYPQGSVKKPPLEQARELLGELLG